MAPFSNFKLTSVHVFKKILRGFDFGTKVAKFRF